MHLRTLAPHMRRAAALALLLGTARGDEASHSYTKGEEIKLWANKVGPYHNPQETYLYHSLPFCHPSVLEHRYDELGEVLEGNDLISSGLAIRFGYPVDDHTKVCSMMLSDEDASQLQFAVRQSYWYQMYLDELPVWGMVGELGVAEATADADADGAASPGANDVPSDLEDGAELEGGEPLVYTHKAFTIAYNADRIIHVNLTSENPVSLSAGATLDFTYAVSWVPTDIPYKRRFDRYLDYDFFEHQIHWFSIFNSCMMVAFLTGIVSLILVRTLRKDYAKYAREGDLEELDHDLDESGWKQIHGDVFRPPSHLPLFCALVGTGAHLASMVVVMILWAAATTLYMDRGRIVVSFIVVYCLTALVGGYTSGGLYSRSGGRRWIAALVHTATLFPGVCLLLTGVCNLVAICYGSLSYVPLASLLKVVGIWVVVALPLCLCGTLLGRHWAGRDIEPCRVNAIPRLIPEKNWYATPPVLIALGGMLPFGSIFIEMYFAFTSFWNYKFYYVYGFLALVYAILAVVTVCVTIVVTYFLLNNEDHRWQWTAFAASASTAVYVMGYSVFYFFAKTKMSGFFQTTFYFTYMGAFCLALGLLCGFLGYSGSALFVRRIYRNIKSD